MVLQLTDFTSEITDEELREFTSEYYIPFALHPVVPAASASIADFPEGKVGGSLPRDERPPPGSYSMEDAELINENRIPINAYSEAFLCHMGISRNYFRSPEEVPTFIGDDGQEMDLFSVVHLSKPKLVTEGVRPLRDGEEPLLESTAGRTMELVLEQPEVESTDVLAPIPLRSVPGATVEPPRLDATSVGSSGDADVVRAESEAGEVDSGLKRKRATSDDDVGTSKRVHYVSLGGSTSTEEETPDAPPMLAAKEVTETPPLNVEATSDSSAPVTHAGQSPPQTSPLTADDISRRDRETGPKAFEGMPVDQLMEEFDMVTAQQAALVAQLRARFSSERSQSVQKDEEILLLKTQLADAQAEAESSRSHAQKLAEEKMALLVKNNHFAGLDEFRQRVEELLEKQEEKLRKLSIEYDEELYPHMLSAIAERGWLIRHGLRLAAMGALESQEVKQSFGDVVKCALARGKAEAVEELHEQKLLTVPAAQVPGYNDNAYEELVAAMEAMKLLELPQIAQLERDQDYPIDVIMAGLTLARHATEGAEAQPDYFLKPDVAQLQVPIFASPRDILNPFALEKEIPLKESLEAHAIRLAKKKGVKGKAILCGVGAAHIPRSDGVPVSVATVSPKDSELLGKLEEAGDAAYQVGSVEATSDSSAPVTHAGQSPPQTSPLTADDISRRDRETGPKAFEGMPVDQLMEEFDMVTAQQAALVAQLRARFSSERSQSVQKDEEILLLKTQLADAQAEAESSRSHAQKLAEEKMALLVKNNHFAGLDEFRQRVEELLEKQEEKLRKLSIEYDEELYPHMLSAIAERRWLISHGLRLAAMGALESQEVKQSFGDVVKCALARGKAEAVEELHEQKLLTVSAAQVPGYNDNAYEELVAAMEAMKLLELPQIAQLERDQDYPIDVIMAGLTLARHATEGAEAQPDYFLKPDVAQLQESLEAHAIRLAKKKGVKGKAILCGVGAAHIPRSDGVPVSVATVSPKDSELLGKLEEAGDAAYQVGSSEQSRCHSI
ncbi:hypothetical protein Tco_1032903 [Tanacetum coccineum]|uniref:Uncharacterized protein n=1 Tax=Tanacetum coccineum TaxID=301880 RepID=A0ABQ5GF83_9ASTR